MASDLSLPSPLSVDRLYRVCPEEVFSFQTTRDLPPLDTLVGQPRAVEALSLGLAFRRRGFNIYVAGPPGTGKRTFVLQELQRVAAELPTPPDLVYLYNFQDPNRPNAVHLPAGYGRRLREDMRTLVENVRRALQTAFESEAFAQARQEILRENEQRKQAILSDLQSKAGALGFQVQMTPFGIVLIPIWEGKPLSPQDFARLAPDIRANLEHQRKLLEEDVQRVLQTFRKIDRETQEKVRELERQTARNAIQPLFDEMIHRYRDIDEIPRYLEDVREDMLKNFQVFLQQGEPPQGPQNPLRRYEVNVLVDHAQTQGAPVVFEHHPSFTNLAGRVEREAVMGVLQSDFTLVRAGSFHRANGGFLVIEALEPFKYPWAYDVLKQILKTGSIQIQDPGERLGVIPTRGVDPEPVPFNGKVILLGDAWLYHLLYQYDPDFPELFKIKSPFDTTMPWTEENVQMVARFVATLTREEDLLPFDPSGVAALVEYASRVAGDQEKITLRFAVLADLVEEAHFFARKAQASTVSREHVEEALRQRRYRLNLYEEKVLEMIRRGSILVDVEGQRTGTVNGLAVFDLGDFRFARPYRITARATPSRAEGILNIEKEAGLSGKIHNKAVLILGGFFKAQYGGRFPLSFSAQIAFEQSYGMLEGDSATVAELLALLSAIAEIPVRQDIAITGSLNQWGEVQPVGGVNEKIEGFFRTCREKGLTGTQGVIIPVQNVKNLMLDRDVRDAVRAGKFHIWAVRHLDEVIPLMTGLPAGTRQDDGTFEEGSFHARVMERLERFYEVIRARRQDTPPSTPEGNATSSPE